jgi:hypothetical protein
MAQPVAIDAERDQVFFGVIAQQTSGLNVVNLKISHAAANLAAPSVSLEDPSMKFLVDWNIEL